MFHNSVSLSKLTFQAATVFVSSSMGQCEGGDGGPSGGVPGWHRPDQLPVRITRGHRRHHDRVALRELSQKQTKKQEYFPHASSSSPIVLPPPPQKQVLPTGEKRRFYYQDASIQQTQPSVPFIDRISVNGSSGTQLTLTIRNVHLEDEQEYICRVTTLTKTEFGEGRTWLKVFGKPSHTVLLSTAQWRVLTPHWASFGLKRF